jgi:3-oxoacyl-[acyl-carrier protein] reductase
MAVEVQRDALKPARRRFEDKSVVVTGAASGIGRADALAFGAEGAAVAVLDIAEGAGQETVDMLRKNSADAVFLHCDVTDEASVEQSLAAVVERFGALDVLVANTGVLYVDTAEKTALEDWNRMLGLNLTSAFLCAKHAIPRMRENGGGSIVCMSSGSGFRPRAGIAAYAAAKAGIINFVKSLAKETAADGIRANCVAPIATETPLLEHMLTRFSEGKDRAEVERQIIEAIPMKRFATVQEIADAVLFLASDDSSAISGHCLVVDCGAFA